CDPTVTARILLFFFTDTATTEIFALSLHDALPILYSKVGQLKFSRFIKHFYYFLKFRDFISSQIRVNFSKLKQVNPKIKGFRFLDRKSTRLNSSHVKISYAVFCLKKKIKGRMDRAN